MPLCVYCISCLQFSDIGGMAEVDEQRACIKFCVRLGKTGSETFEMLKQAFGDSCMSRSLTFEWYVLFKNGRTLIRSAKHSNNPLKSGTATGGCQPGSLSYHTRSLCRAWNWLWILSANSHRTAEHASDCSKVCAESVDPGSERQSSSDMSGTEGNCDKQSHTPLERHHRR